MCKIARMTISGKAVLSGGTKVPVKLCSLLKPGIKQEVIITASKNF